MKCFDIEIAEFDEERGMQTRREMGVFAPSRKILAQTYADCGARIKIIREYEKENDVTEGMPEQSPPSRPALPPPPVPSDPPTADPPEPTKVIQPLPTSHPCPPIHLPTKAETPVPVDPKPKFFSVAGIECKLENGKVYQKQWVKLLGQSASNYRLISDKNNREIPLVGKHLEVLKWVSVEDEEQKELNDSILQIING